MAGLSLMAITFLCCNYLTVRTPDKAAILIWVVMYLPFMVKFFSG